MQNLFGHGDGHFHDVLPGFKENLRAVIFEFGDHLAEHLNAVIGFLEGRGFAFGIAVLVAFFETGLLAVLESLRARGFGFLTRLRPGHLNFLGCLRARCSGLFLRAVEYLIGLLLHGNQIDCRLLMFRFFRLIVLVPLVAVVARLRRRGEPFFREHLELRPTYFVGHTGNFLLFNNPHCIPCSFYILIKPLRLYVFA